MLLAGGGESVRMSASSFRFAVGGELGWDTIRSDHFEVRSSSGQLLFEGFGAGHGVGLCQRGAEQMGTAGRTYGEILAFYYPGTVLGWSAQGISWRRLGGPTISLFTTDTDHDRIVLDTAERLAHQLEARTNWPLPAGVEIRTYPDLDSFRNASGEPGWVAAYTAGKQIHLQPATLLRSRGVLESTIRHELLHVLIESQAKPGLPLWFREGLAGVLAGGLTAGAATRIPSDNELRRPADAASARRVYREAQAMVAKLVRSYGESAVLSWVQRGLPPA